MGEVISAVIEGIKVIFEGNYTELILFLSTILLSIWLYREFRKNIIDTEADRRTQTYNLLKVLTDLELELKEFRVNRLEYDILKEKLINAIPYLSYSLSKKTEHFHKEMDDKYIKEFLNELREEINQFKYNQTDSFSHVNEKSLWRIFEYQYKTKFDSIVNPFIMTFFTVFIIMLLLMINLSITSMDTIQERIIMLVHTIATIFFIIFLISIIDLLTTKKIVNKFKSWLFLIAFFVVSVLSLLFYPNNIYIKVALIVFYILSLILLPKIIIKKN